MAKLEKVMTGNSWNEEQSNGGELKRKSDVSSEKGENEKERITLRLPSAVYARLEELRDLTYASNVNEVIKTAILFYDTLVRERIEGNDIFVISPEGEKTKYAIFR